jgi:hypothetical protein
MSSAAFFRATHALAEPGKSWLVTLIHPDEPTRDIYGEPLTNIMERHPAAVPVLLDDWTATRAAEQDAPVEWQEVTAERFEEMLNVLPPIYFPGGFLVSEPCDHHARTGRPRYSAFRQEGGRYFASSRPMQVSEVRR